MEALHCFSFYQSQPASLMNMQQLYFSLHVIPYPGVELLAHLEWDLNLGPLVPFNLIRTDALAHSATMAEYYLQ